MRGAVAGLEATVAIPEAGLLFKSPIVDNGIATINVDVRDLISGQKPCLAPLKVWSPDHPKLYKVEISAEGDRITDEIGFRTIEARGTQLLLNGKPIFLRGISMHDEAPFRSGRRTFSEEDGRTLLSWAKELGCNFVRLAHYPHNEDTMRLADQMGLLVWEEVSVYWEMNGRAQTL
jgi:beta-glucuronidase